MVKIPDRGETVDKELLKNVICFVIDNYYNTGYDIEINGEILNDDEPLDLTDISKDNFDFREDVRIVGTFKKRYAEASAENPEESFAKALKQLIKDSGMSHVEVYTKANVSRAAFNRIMKNPESGVSKRIALAFCVALHLSVYETNELIGKLGYVLSRSSKRDLIVAYCFNHNQYDIFEINTLLYNCGQEILGTSARE